MIWTKWTNSEKELLSNLVNENGAKWCFISSKLGRSDDSCRNMWMRMTNKERSHTRKPNEFSRYPWSKEEDQKIKELMTEQKDQKKINWKQIKHLFENRSANSIRNRVKRIKFQEEESFVFDIASALLNDF